MLRGQAVVFSDEPVRYFLDRKVRYVIPGTNKYSAYNDYTEVSLKDVYGAVPKIGSATYCLVGTDGYYHQVTDWDDNGVFKVTGDLRGMPYFVGRQYEFDVVLSRPTIKKTTSDGATISEDEGRLHLRN